MEHFDYYIKLAEETFFCGMTADRLDQLVKYRPNKSFTDFAEFIDKGRLENIGKAENEFGGIARRLYQILEIDTKEKFNTFEIRLVDSRERKFYA